MERDGNESGEFSNFYDDTNGRFFFQAYLITNIQKRKARESARNSTTFMKGVIDDSYTPTVENT